MRRLWRLGVVATIAVVLFAVALVRFSHAAAKACVPRVTPDPAYGLAWEPPPRTGPTTYRLTVSRDGAPVGAARVCLNASLAGTPAVAVTEAGREVAPGTYELDVNFTTPGRWAGQVVISTDGHTAGAPASITVAAR